MIVFKCYFILALCSNCGSSSWKCPKMLTIIFFLSISVTLFSLRRGHTLSRSSSPKMEPLTLVQTLFNVVNAFTKQQKTQIFFRYLKYLSQPKF